MELTKIEVASVEVAVNEAAENAVRELNDLQMLLVGGGCGETIL
jgi:hypothetical protein